MSSERQQIEAGIAALEAQRGLLGDAVVDMAVAPLRAKLAALEAPAAPPPEPSQALKQVSILFLDVVGSTTLSQHLDPEAISAVMDDALARGTAVVEQHRGRVLQYAGDNILAAFGANEAREDDAERAVLCGLALLALGEVLGAEVQAAHGHAGFNVRVGVHTGGVLLGGGVDAEGSIRGIAVNIAARMEQTAPAGALRISHDTYAQVRGMFDVEVQEPLLVKGVDAPVQSYLVTRAKPRSFRIRTRGIEGVATRMIGRDAELEILQAAFRRLFEARRLAAITVVAEAGIGKSRLLYEFEAWSEARPERFFLFRGRATPATGLQTFGLLRDIIAWRFQIADDDSVETARRKLEDGIVPLFVHDDGPDLAEGHAHLLGHLIGIEWRDSRHIKGILDDPKQLRNRALHTATQLFRRVSVTDGSPVILQLEDLHWSDGETLDFLEQLFQVNRDVPLLVLAFTRPTLFERRAGWGRAEGMQRVDLQPLDTVSSAQLAGELLHKLPEVPAALRDLLTRRAAGNPFYMEELLKMLIDQGVIQTGQRGEGWTLDARRALPRQVPATLTGVLQARLDGLPAAEKRALQQASVVGTVFWDQALAAVDGQAPEHLPALVQRELALPRADAQLDGLREYAFRHQVLHQVTYDTVLKRHKREAHARVAQWLAGLIEQGSLRASDLFGQAAEHFEQAGDSARAAEFHARAAEQAGQRLAHDRVLWHAGRALALLGDSTPDSLPAQVDLRWRLLLVRHESLDLLARRDEQAADLEALERLADGRFGPSGAQAGAGQGDDRRRAEVGRRRAMDAMRKSDWAAMHSAAAHGMACATRAGDDTLRLKTLRLQAGAAVFRGDIEAGRTLALKGLEEARRLNLPGVEARLVNTLSIACERQGNLVGSLELNRQCLSIYRALGDRANETAALSNMATSWTYLGGLSQARRDLDAVLNLLQNSGDRLTHAYTLITSATLSLWEGAPAQAHAQACLALELTVATQGLEEKLLATLRLGDAELALGRTTEARQAYAQAQRWATEIDSVWHVDTCVGLARVALAEGDALAARQCLLPVIDRVAAGDALEGTEFPRLVEWTCYQALSGVGDPRAANWLLRAHTALMAQAEAISQHSADAAVREGFLHNVPHHRAIVAAWAAASRATEVA